MYYIKEIFYSLQGEGHNAGRPAIFCRFSGCNLWSGKEADRSKAICKFCDTDFVGIDGTLGGKYTSAKELAEVLSNLWEESTNISAFDAFRFVVFTGGEPALQLTSELLSEVKARGFYVAIETNGTLALPRDIDWITVSPKAGTTLALNSGSELKLVFPQTTDPQTFVDLQFEHFYISPMMTNSVEDNREHLKKALAYCLKNPRWKLTYQFHKIWNIR